jgi:hypothetical protein
LRLRADCEHEIRPLRAGYRLCLVYNLTLAKSKKRITAPRRSEQVERMGAILREWADADVPRKLVVTLEHQYTAEGLAWDALKGVDRARAQALLEGASRADCQALLGLLTLHQSGAAEGDWDYGYRGRWYDEEEDAGQHEMGEIYETSLTAEHWTDADGKRLPLGTLAVDEGEVLDPEAIEDVEPEEEFEGYTGNEGMTLERWYRHAAIFLWPNKRHFDVLCDAGTWNAVESLGPLVGRWQKSGKKKGAALRAECIDFASAILSRWSENPYDDRFPEKTQPCPLFRALAALGEPRLIQTYLGEVLPKDAAVDPGKALAPVCREHGWETFQQPLEAAFQRTTSETLERNVRLLEHVSLAGPGKKTGWSELCQALAVALVAALERIDAAPVEHDWRARRVSRADVLAGLARSLLATDQDELLSRLVEHALAHPEKYPLTEAHIAALTALGPWLRKHVKKPCPALSHWLAACREQLEALTAQEPQPPADFRREAPITCRCADCAELRRFLVDPHEAVHRFRAAEARRRHLEDSIRYNHCDLDRKTERTGSPHTLVCTKNAASYQEKLRKYHRDQEHLATVRSIAAACSRHDPRG